MDEQERRRALARQAASGTNWGIIRAVLILLGLGVGFVVGTYLGTALGGAAPFFFGLFIGPAVGAYIGSQLALALWAR